jgi:hypothetical protein
VHTGARGWYRRVGHRWRPLPAHQAKIAEVSYCAGDASHELKNGLELQFVQMVERPKNNLKQEAWILYMNSDSQPDLDNDL